VLTDELTNISVWSLETGENELTNRSVQIQRWIIDADAHIDEFTTDQFMNTGKKNIGELTTDQFTNIDTV
jgi:hypothetical protein